VRQGLVGGGGRRQRRLCGDWRSGQLEDVALQVGVARVAVAPAEPADNGLVEAAPQHRVDTAAHVAHHRAALESGPGGLRGLAVARGARTQHVQLHPHADADAVARHQRHVARRGAPVAVVVEGLGRREVRVGVGQQKVLVELGHAAVAAMLRCNQASLARSGGSLSADYLLADGRLRPAAALCVLYPLATCTRRNVET